MIASLRRTSRLTVAVATIAATLVLAVPPAQAAVSVTCPGQSLQAAIDAAPAGETINLTGTCLEAIDINKNLTIVGTGPTSAVIDATGKNESAIDIISSPSVTLSQLTVTGGGGPGEFTGGIDDNEGNGTLTISNSVITGNASTEGGGIWVSGTLNMDSTVVSNNTAAQSGGGIFSLSGDLTITNSNISGNVASLADGGMSNVGTATLSLSDSTVTGNESLGFGGGIGVDSGATVTITGSTIEGNTAAQDGGGIDSDGTLVIRNSTLTGNTSGSLEGDVGAIWTSGTATLEHVTAVGNTGNTGGILNQSTSPSSVMATASIVAANTGTGSAPDCSGILASGGNNVIGDNTGCTFANTTGDLWGTSASPVDPLVAALADNGGPTRTMALLAGSPARDRSPGPCTLGTDQRGFARPQGSGCDSGAYEAANEPPPPPPDDNTVGLVDVTQGKWYLRNSAGVITSFFYGNPVDLPIAGDWDGDGDATPGLYRQSDGFFYARNSNTQGPADDTCFAGDPSDIPIVGDWDGDGDDNLGIYRPSEQKFYLFTITCTGSPMGAAQISFLFGNPGDKPVAGDWDGDGRDEIGLHRESSGFFYWRNTLTTGVADGEIFFGDPGDRFVSGDWGLVDEADSPAIFRPSGATFYFRHTLTQGNADSQFPWTGAGSQWLPVAGTFGLG